MSEQFSIPIIPLQISSGRTRRVEPLGVGALFSSLREQNESDRCRARAWPEVKRVLAEEEGLVDATSAHNVAFSKIVVPGWCLKNLMG